MFSILYPPMLFSLLSLLLFPFLPLSTADEDLGGDSYYNCYAAYALAPFIHRDCQSAHRAIDLFHSEMGMYDHSSDEFQPPRIVLPLALQWRTCTVLLRQAPFFTGSPSARPTAPASDWRRESFSLWGDLSSLSRVLVEACVVPRRQGGLAESAASIGGIDRPIDVLMMSSSYFAYRVDPRNTIHRLDLQQLR